MSSSDLALLRDSSNNHISNLLEFHANNQQEAISSLLDTLVEGRFHIERNATIRSPSHINVLLFGLLPRLDPLLQPGLVDTFASMVHRHIRNAETCRRANVTQNLVTLLSTMEVTSELRTSFVFLLQAIGSHSTTINDVYTLFRPIVALHQNKQQQQGEEARPRVALLLLRAMEAMVSNKRRRSNVSVIIVRVVLIGSFLFYCLLSNHSFQTNPNKITNCF